MRSQNVYVKIIQWFYSVIIKVLCHFFRVKNPTSFQGDYISACSVTIKKGQSFWWQSKNCKYLKCARFSWRKCQKNMLKWKLQPCQEQEFYLKKFKNRYQTWVIQVSTFFPPVFAGCWFKIQLIQKYLSFISLSDLKAE